MHPYAAGIRHAVVAAPRPRLLADPQFDPADPAQPRDRPTPSRISCVPVANRNAAHGRAAVLVQKNTATNGGNQAIKTGSQTSSFLYNCWKRLAGAHRGGCSMPAFLPVTVVLFATVSVAAALAADASTVAGAIATSHVYEGRGATLQNRCQVCHRPDTFAPMSLLTYEEVRPWAKSIRQKVLAREMPPWYIDRNVGVRHFKNDVSLSDEEIATIVNWVDSGAPKGDPADMPQAAQVRRFRQVAHGTAGSDRDNCRKTS